MIEIYILFALIFVVVTVIFILAYIFSKKIKEANLIMSEKDLKIKNLSEAIEKAKLGVVAQWLPVNEKESSIRIRIMNDSSKKAYNIKVVIPDKYKDTCEVFAPSDFLDSDANMEVGFFPFRQQFALRWFKDSLTPIPIKIQYTNSPQSEEFKCYDLVLDVQKVQQHLRSIIEKISELDEGEIENIIYLEKAYRSEENSQID